MQRHRIRELLDLVPQSQLDKVAELLRCILHPAQVRRDDLRYGNEPVSPELLAAIEQSEREIAEGRVFTMEEVMAELGIDPATLGPSTYEITNLDRWVCEHQPDSEQSYGKGWWDFIEDIRRFADKLQLREIDVVGSYILHTPPPGETLLSPVVAFQTPGCCVHLKHDFGQWDAPWTISVKRSDKRPLPGLALFLDPSALTERSLDGLDPAWIFPPYELDTERFTTRMADRLDVYAALRLLFSGGEKGEVNADRSAH